MGTRRDACRLEARSNSSGRARNRLGYAELLPVHELPDGSALPFARVANTDPHPADGAANHDRHAPHCLEQPGCFQKPCYLAEVVGDALARFEIEAGDVVLLRRVAPSDRATPAGDEERSALRSAVHSDLDAMHGDLDAMHGELIAVALVDVLCAGRPLLPAEAPDADRRMGLFKAWQRTDDPGLLTLVGRAPLKDGCSIYTLRPGAPILGIHVATRRAGTTPIPSGRAPS